MINLVARDERESAIDSAADRLSFLVLAYGLLVLVAIRAFNGEATCEKQPRNGNDHDLQVPSGVHVTVNARISPEQSTPVPNDVRTGEQIDDEK